MGIMGRIDKTNEFIRFLVSVRKNEECKHYQHDIDDIGASFPFLFKNQKRHSKNGCCGTSFYVQHFTICNYTVAAELVT